MEGGWECDLSILLGVWVLVVWGFMEGEFLCEFVMSCTCFMGALQSPCNATFCL